MVSDRCDFIHELRWWSCAAALLCLFGCMTEAEPNVSNSLGLVQCSCKISPLCASRRPLLFCVFVRLICVFESIYFLILICFLLMLAAKYANSTRSNGSNSPPWLGLACCLASDPHSFFFRFHSFSLLCRFCQFSLVFFILVVLLFCLLLCF